MARHPQINSLVFPTISSERLELVPISQMDVPTLFELRKDPRMNQYIDRKKFESEQDAIELISKIESGIADRKWIFWKVQLKGTTELIGSVCLWLFNETLTQCDIGYELSPLHWGKGYMNESLSPVLTYGFDHLKFECIQAFTHRENVASIKLLVRHNFKFIMEKKLESIYRLHKS